MQKNEFLYKSGKSLTAKGFVGVICFGVIDKIGQAFNDGKKFM